LTTFVDIAIVIGTFVVAQSTGVKTHPFSSSQVVVITINSIASFSRTSIIIITIDANIITSRSVVRLTITIVYSTSIVVVTIVSVKTQPVSLSQESMNGTSVVIVANNRSVGTSRGIITRFVCASIVIFAYMRGINASRGSITRIVVTNVWDRVASVLSIAQIDRTKIAVVAVDRGILTSVIGFAVTFGTSVVQLSLSQQSIGVYCHRFDNTVRCRSR